MLIICISLATWTNGVSCVLQLFGTSQKQIFDLGHFFHVTDDLVMTEKFSLPFKMGCFLLAQVLQRFC